MRRRLFVADAIRIPGVSAAADAVLVRDGRVVAVGTAEQLRSQGLAEERFPGGVIVPGMRDAHLHPAPYAVTVTRLNLDGIGDLPELLDRLRAADRSLPPGRPLVATRLDDQALAEGRLPTRDDLDRAVRDRPVLLYRYCGHVAVANTAALAAADVGPHTTDPSGGRFDRDDVGHPIGILRETAVEVVARALYGADRLGAAELLASMQGLASLGITSVGAMIAADEGPWCADADELGLLDEIARDLPIDLGVYVIASSTEAVEASARRLARMGPRVRFLGVKDFADGSFGGHTAAMYEPYTDRPDTRGMLRLDAEAVAAKAKVAYDLGGGLALHAIGDAAVDAAVALFQRLADQGLDPTRMRLEHASVVTEHAVERLASLGAVASVQPAFLASEARWLERRLGAERLRRTYAFGTLVAAGVRVAAGSDSPVEPPDPFVGMATARDRMGVVPSEDLGADEAFALFTTLAASALGEPAPLAPGSPADLVVVDRDPLTVDPDALRRTRVLTVVKDGRILALPDEAPVLR